MKAYLPAIGVVLGLLLVAALVTWAVAAPELRVQASERHECEWRLSLARSAADTLRVLNEPQGARQLYCGYFIDYSRGPR